MGKIDWASYNRGTGRTSRMLEAAVEAAKKGEACSVVVSDEYMAEVVFDRLIKFGEFKMGRMVSFAGGGSIIVQTQSQSHFSWTDGLPVDGSTRRIFVDHFVIEEEMAWALEQWLSVQNG